MITQLILTSCAIKTLDDSDSDDIFDPFLEEWDELRSCKEYCKSVTDAYKFPNNLTREDLDKYDLLPTEYFQKISSCGLLETLLQHPINRIFGAFDFTCSDMWAPGVSIFNSKLRENKAAVELFGRKDFFPVIVSRYLTFGKEKKDWYEDNYMSLSYFGWFLASDLCMDAIKEKEKVMLMALVLNSKISFCGTLNIVISIMNSCNYAPFVRDIMPKLHESMFGYTMCSPYDDIIRVGLTKSEQDLIMKYAKQFLNDNK